MERFGRYILVDQISSGGMADVYRAKVVGIRGFTKTVAIKRIHPHLLERKRFLRMFTDEAKIASRLVHPNVVQIYDLGEADGLPYIAMEYVPGRDLFRVLQRLINLERRCPWRLATKIVSDVCAGLQFAHEFRSPDGQPQEIVHRDVSPRNILISYNGEIKLTDFGVARARDREEHTEHGIIKGKVRYLSPEAAYAREVDGRSDLFSLGIVFAELLLMEPLRSGPNEMAMLLDIRKGEFDRNRFKPIPKPLRTVLNKALEVDPDKRFPTALDFAVELANRFDADSTPMSEAEIATFMRALFDDDIVAEEARDKEVELELRAKADQFEIDLPRADAVEVTKVRRLNPLNIFADRGAGPVAVPALGIEDHRPAKPTRVGSFQEISLVRLLHEINEGRISGILDFHRDPIKKSIEIEAGNPVFANSNVESELFGEYLVAQGALSREQHAEVLDFAARKGLRFSEALLELGACTSNELFQQLSGQVRNRILDLFSWISGRFELFVDAPVAKTGLPLNLRAHTLIHEGVQERMPLVVIRRFMDGNLNQWVVRLPGAIPADLQLSGRQQRILRSIEGNEIKVAELIRREGDEEWMLRLLYMLHQIRRVMFHD
jgi:tRNA A-37 threonylcarbamoyl transferase component Bud32